VGVFPSWPLVVAANRDEYLARPAAPPTLLRETPPRAFGGRDLTAGGTWLGVSEVGLVAGMLNRRSTVPPDPACRSRGQLCLDLLGCATAAEAAARGASACTWVPTERARPRCSSCRRAPSPSATSTPKARPAGRGSSRCPCPSDAASRGERARSTSIHSAHTVSASSRLDEGGMA